MSHTHDKTAKGSVSCTAAGHGHGAGPAADDGPPPPWWRTPRGIAALGSGFLLGVGYLLELAAPGAPYSHWAFAFSVVVGAWYFAQDAWLELRHERRVDIELLMTVGAAVAVLLGKYSQGAVLAFLYSITEALEHHTMEKTRYAIRAMMDLAPQEALVRRNGDEVIVPLEEIQVGDVVLIRPGDRVPVDGIVRWGTTAVDESPITGESVPVDKKPGDQVFAGTINTHGAVEVEATATWENTLLRKIIHLVEEAQEQKGRAELFIDRFTRIYSPSVLGGSFLVMLVPSLVTGQWSEWAIRAATVLVAASPCALAISAPITMVAAIGTAARSGILIKGGAFVEALARVRVVAFDKTGTITEGRPEVAEVVPLNGAHDDQVLRIAASIERLSEHPLARAIVEKASELGLAGEEASDFAALPGAGARAVVAGQQWFVGRPELFEELGVQDAAAAEQVVRLQREGLTVVLVGTTDQVIGAIALRDKIRPAARKCMDGLHRLGVDHLLLLTGDSQPAAEAVARAVGIDEVRAGLRPDEKVEEVKRHIDKYGPTAMVGDGVNDAPALAAATVGVAMGVAGTDVALETADVALMADDLERLPLAFKLGRRASAVVKQNIAFSLLTVAILVVSALTGALSLAAAVVGHEASELIVVANGLRLLRRPRLPGQRPRDAGPDVRHGGGA